MHIFKTSFRREQSKRGRCEVYSRRQHVVAIQHFFNYQLVKIAKRGFVYVFVFTQSKFDEVICQRLAGGHKKRPRSTGKVRNAELLQCSMIRPISIMPAIYG